MAQHDYNIANQSFPSFRTDLNNALSAIQTCNSGTSRPTGAVAGQIWLDTTSATSPTLKYYDGADDISLATIDHVGNTVNWLDSTVSITGLSTTATGTVLTLTDSDTSSSVNLILQNQKEIRFSETTANGTNYVGFKAPASLSADKIWILPSADGTAGQFLKTDGAGNLSFDSLSFSTPLAVIGNATAGSEIRLPEDTDNGSNYVAIKAPDTLASNLTLTLPSADGTSGQVLQTNGSGVLSFSSPSSDFVKLATTAITANTASVSFDGYFSSTYKNYMFIGSHLKNDADGGLRMKYRQSNADVSSADYVWSQNTIRVSSGASAFDGNGGIEGFLRLASTNVVASERAMNFQFYLFDPLNTSYFKYYLGSAHHFYTDPTQYLYFHHIGGTFKGNTTALSGVTFYMSSGNLDDGSISLYGIKH